MRESIKVEKNHPVVIDQITLLALEREKIKQGITRKLKVTSDHCVPITDSHYSTESLMPVFVIERNAWASICMFNQFDWDDSICWGINMETSNSVSNCNQPSSCKPLFPIGERILKDPFLTFSQLLFHNCQPFLLTKIISFLWMCHSSLIHITYWWTTWLILSLGNCE